MQLGSREGFHIFQNHTYHDPFQLLVKQVLLLDMDHEIACISHVNAERSHQILIRNDILQGRHIGQLIAEGKLQRQCGCIIGSLCIRRIHFDALGLARSVFLIDFIREFLLLVGKCILQSISFLLIIHDDLLVFGCKSSKSFLALLFSCQTGCQSILSFFYVRGAVGFGRGNAKARHSTADDSVSHVFIRFRHSTADQLLG